MARVMKINSHEEGAKQSGRFRVTRHIFIENLEETPDSNKQKHDRRKIRRETKLRVDRSEDQNCNSSDSDSWSDDGREFQSSSSQTAWV